MPSEDSPPEGTESASEANPFPDNQEEMASSLMDRLQAAWVSRQPKWYERLAPAQKHWVDKLVALRLEEFQAHLSALDREDSELSRQIAELTVQIVQLNRRMISIEAKLEALERDGRAGDDQTA